MGSGKTPRSGFGHMEIEGSTLPLNGSTCELVSGNTQNLLFLTPAGTSGAPTGCQALFETLLKRGVTRAATRSFTCLPLRPAHTERGTSCLRQTEFAVDLTS